MATTEEQSQTALESMIERFRNVLANSPKNPTVLLGFAEANLRRGRRLEALQAYQQVLGLTPDVSDAHMAVAEIYLLHGLPLEAYDELRKVFELEPGRPEAHLLLHEIEPLAPVPQELERLRLQYPTDLQVAETHSRLVLEIEHLVREVEQLRESGEGASAEPVAAYHLEQARKRLARTQHLLGLLDSLPTGVPEPPRPEPLAPMPELPQLEEGFASQEPVYETQEMDEAASADGPQDLELPDLAQIDAPGPDEEVPSLEELLGDTSDLDLGESADSHDIEDFFSSLAIEEPQPSEPEEEAPLPVVEEPEPAGAISAARIAFYDSVSAGLREAVDELLRTRGLTSIFLVSVEGHVIAHQSRDSITPEQMGTLVVSLQHCLRSYSDDLAYWALECDGGIVLLQQLDDRHGLVAIGQAGASFAMIRLNLDKAKSKLAEPLAGAPHD